MLSAACASRKTTTESKLRQRNSLSDSRAVSLYPLRVLSVRRLVTQSHLNVLICAAALLLKLLVPTGYMIDSDHGRITITICSGITTRTATLEMSGMHGDMPDHSKAKDHSKVEMPCAFSGLSAATLGAIDPIQLVALIAFITAIGLFASVLRAPAAPPHLRPPLRGPPAHL